jgi:hypothetical protein
MELKHWTPRGYNQLLRTARIKVNAQTSMPQVGFEATISVFERAKTVHALQTAQATVIGPSYCTIW